MTAHLHHLQDRGVPEPRQGPNLASKVLTKHQHRNPAQEQWVQSPSILSDTPTLQNPKLEAKPLGRALGAKEGENRLAPHAHL